MFDAVDDEADVVGPLDEADVVGPLQDLADRAGGAVAFDDDGDQGAELACLVEIGADDAVAAVPLAVTDGDDVVTVAQAADDLGDVVGPLVLAKVLKVLDGPVHCCSPLLLSWLDMASHTARYDSPNSAD